MDINKTLSRELDKFINGIISIENGELENSSTVRTEKRLCIARIRALFDKE